VADGKALTVLLFAQVNKPSISSHYSFSSIITHVPLLHWHQDQEKNSFEEVVGSADARQEVML
jgi:hypothetical protein